MILNAPARDHDFHETAMDVAFRLLVVKNYRGEFARAVVALERRCPGRPGGECAAVLERWVALDQAAEEFVDTNIDAAMAIYRSTQSSDLSSISQPLYARFPDLPADLIDNTVSWCLYYYHLR